MKKLLGLSFLLFFVVVGFAQSAEQNPPVYLGAQGGGQYVTGGRGGDVLIVNSLLDDQDVEGTLRWAVRKKGPRTIIFKVAGIIELNSELKINNGDLTIAGHSAPGDGICISKYPVVVSADNVVVQFLRFRLGDEVPSQTDALQGLRRNNVLIDHCSMSWSTDECSSFYDNENFSMQWCILSESLKNSTHQKGAHGYGGIWGGVNASYHHNLLAHHDSRNPRFCGSRYSNQPDRESVDFRNNVIYNWGENSGYAGEGGSYNIVNNYYKPGPSTLSHKGSSTYRIFSPNSDEGNYNQPTGVWGRFFVNGNVMHGKDEVTSNNWKGIHINNQKNENKTEADLRAVTAFPLTPINCQSAETAYKEVLAKSGASLRRDIVDARIVKETAEGSYTFEGSKGGKNGIIDSQNDVGGWPEYKYKEDELPLDSDSDGMPDAWEEAKGLNKLDAADASAMTLDKRYSNLELYLFSLVSHLY